MAWVAFGEMCVVAVLASVAAGQTCVPSWLPGPGRPGANDDVIATTVFEFESPEGLRRELVAGGDFTQIGDAFGTGAARWDGSRWITLGSEQVRFRSFCVIDWDGAGAQRARLIGVGQRHVPSGSPWNVMQWDGERWVDIGSALNGHVKVVATFDADGDGPGLPTLFAGGSYPSYGPGDRIARWDGSQWVPLSPGIGGFVMGDFASVECMQQFDADGPGPEQPKLIVGGKFPTVGAMTANAIASWNGLGWELLGAGIGPSGTGMPTSVWTMCEMDWDGPGPQAARLIVGGSFQSAGTTAVRSVAQWDGAGWSDVGGGVWTLYNGTEYAGYVYGLASFDMDGAGPGTPVLVAAGAFEQAGSVQSKSIASFDGTAWSSDIRHGVLSTTPPSLQSVCALSEFTPLGAEAPLLVCGASFGLASGERALNIGVREAGEWKAVGRGFYGDIKALTAFDLDGSGPQPEVVIAAGTFLRTPDGAASGGATYDGVSWSPFTPGIGTVWKYRVLDPDGPGPQPDRLFALGTSLAVWETTTWQPMASAAGHRIEELAAFDFDGPGPLTTTLVSAGRYLGGGLAVRRLEGDRWQQVGGILWLQDKTEDKEDVGGLVVLPVEGIRRLVVGGRFDRIGTSVQRNAAYWNGEAWLPLGGGTESPSAHIRHMATFDPDGPGPALETLVATCYLPEPAMAWNDSGWQTVPAATSAMAAYDPDGAGPLPMMMFMRGCAWDGSTARNLGGPVSTGRDFSLEVTGVAVWRRSLMDVGQVVMGGVFDAVDGRASVNFARLTCGLACYANCDESSGSPRLTGNDFICFMTRYAKGDTYANCDGSTVVPVLTASDFQCFLNAFAAGCP